MKKVIFQMSVSLDGYVEGPNKELDWHIVDDEFNAYAAESLQAADTLIMGRKSYALMESYWPTASEVDPVAKYMNERPKLVFSRTLKSVAWRNSSLARGSPTEEVARLNRNSGGGDLWVGGSTLATAFLEEGLIDEVRVMLTPILIGNGATLFDGITKRHPLQLLSTRAFKSGSVLLIYDVRRSC